MLSFKGEKYKDNINQLASYCLTFTQILKKLYYETNLSKNSKDYKKRILKFY